MTKPTILFVCTHNAGRSALGAALAREQAGDRATVLSAGVAPAETASAGTIASLAEIGIDDSGHVPTQLTEELVRSATVVVAMNPACRSRRSTASPMRHGTCPTRRAGRPPRSGRCATTSMTGSPISSCASPTETRRPRDDRGQARARKSFSIFLVSTLSGPPSARHFSSPVATRA